MSDVLSVYLEQKSGKVKFGFDVLINFDLFSLIKSSFFSLQLWLLRLFIAGVFHDGWQQVLNLINELPPPFDFPGEPVRGWLLVWFSPKEDEISANSPFQILFREKRAKMEFEYVVQRKEKEKVCFGSGLERKLLEDDKRGLVSKHARCNIKEILPVGPGSYDIGPPPAIYIKGASNLGTVLGGRKEERGKTRDFRMLTPGPIYDIPTTFPTTFKQCCVPFNVSERKTGIKVLDNPGVGTYPTGMYKRRRMAFAHSFGGPRCLIPAVKMTCNPFYSDVCERCGKNPEGDYWYIDTIENVSYVMSKQAKPVDLYLCRPCYNLEKKEPKVFTKAQIKSFKKMRNCSSVHFHGGCKAKLLLVSPAETAKLKEREAYFSLYFS